MKRIVFPLSRARGISSIEKIVAGTMVFALLTSASWHLGGMRDVHAREERAQTHLEYELVALRGYHAALSSGGLPAGKDFLVKLQTPPYAF